MKRVLDGLVVAVGMIILALPTLALAASPAAVVKSHDLDKDGTLSLAEVHKAAAAHMAKADPDKDGTLTRKEAAAAGVTSAEFAKANPDKDGTLSKQEYLRLVDVLYKEADADHDGTVSAAELETPVGRRLKELIQ